MGTERSANDPYSNEKKSHGFVSLRTDICSPLRYSAITDITFWRMTVDIFLSDFQSITNVFRIFIFQRLMSSFLWNRFYVDRLSNVCTYTLHFIVLLCVLGNGMGTGIPWELERIEIDCMRLGGSGSVKLPCVKFYFRSSLFRTTIAADRPIRRRNISHPTLGGTDRAWMFLKPSEWSG